MRSVDLLVHQLAFTQYVILENCKGISQEESLRHPEPAGSCLNWVVGHILVARNQLLTVLGREPIWDEAKGARYKRGSEPLHQDGTGVHRIDSLLQDIHITYDRLKPALTAFPENKLTDKAPYSPVNNVHETWGSLLSGLLFHEAYHAGQTGVLRRVAGKVEQGLT